MANGGLILSTSWHCNYSINPKSIATPCNRLSAIPSLKPEYTSTSTILYRLDDSKPLNDVETLNSAPTERAKTLNFELYHITIFADCIGFGRCRASTTSSLRDLEREMIIRSRT